MRYVLGIDGGASKTEIWCASEAGEIVGKGLGGPTNLTATERAAARSNLKISVDQALSTLTNPEIASVVMGLSGFDTAEEKVIAKNVFSPVFDEIGAAQRSIVNDSVVALEGGTERPDAILLISGTGSNCLGRSSSGQMTHVGGLDFLLSDEGSGYQVGMQVLKAAVQSADGRGEKTLLEKLVLDQFMVTEISGLKTKLYNPIPSKSEISSISKLCTQAAHEQDAVAIRLLKAAASELVTMITTVQKKLALNQGFDCVLVGSLAQQREIKAEIALQLEKVQANAVIVIPDKPPVFGAIKMALRSLNSL